MIKSITITVLLVISMTSCVITTQNNEIIILNNADNIVEVDIYNTWSGETENKWTLQKGINKFSLNSNTLYGLYAKGYPEKTIFIHPNASLTFEKEELILDEINQEINAHYVWSQQIITGESQSIFHWHKSKNKLNVISDWEAFDSTLFKLIENPRYKIKQGVLKSKSINSYPAAYVLIDKVCESEHISIASKMKYIKKQLEKSGIQNPAKRSFLNHYLSPQSLSLRNDSIVQYTEIFFPEVAKNISNQYQKFEEDSKLKAGIAFPDFIHDGNKIASSELTEGFDYTIIDFWATWCIPCIKQMPDMNKYAFDYKGKIQFVSLSVDNKRDIDKWLNISNKYNAIKHLWLSDTTTVRDDMGIKGLPRMILLDSKGIIIDPNFPHLYDPLAHQWIKSLTNMPKEKVAEKN